MWLCSIANCTFTDLQRNITFISKLLLMFRLIERTNVPSHIFSLSFALLEITSQDPFKFPLLCTLALSEVRGHLRPRGARLKSRVWFKPDFSCPDFFSHFDHDCEDNPRSSILRHQTARGSAEHAHAGLWVISPSLRDIEHICKARESLHIQTSTLTDRQLWHVKVCAPTAATHFQMRLNKMTREMTYTMYTYNTMCTHSNTQPVVTITSDR